MTKHQEFKTKLEQLKSKIHEFLETCNPKSEAYKMYREKYGKLVILYQALSKALKTGIPSLTEISGCKIESINILQPSIKNAIYRSAFSSTKVLLELKLDATACDFTKTEMELIYYDGLGAKTNSSKAKMNVIEQKGATIKASVEVEFPEKDQKSSVKISIDNITSDKIFFYKKYAVDISSYNKAKKITKNYIHWTDVFYLGTIEPVRINKLCPSLKIKKNGDSNYVKMDAFINALKENQDIVNAENGGIDLGAKSIEALEEIQHSSKRTKSTLNTIIEKFQFNSNVLIELEEQCKQSGVDGVFDAAYRQQVKKNEELLEVLVNKKAYLQTYIDQISKIIFQKSIPDDLLQTVKDLERLKSEQEKTLQKLYEESDSYYTKEVVLDTFDEWKTTLSRINEKCITIQKDWDDLWLPFKTKVLDIKPEEKSSAYKYYLKWKEDIFSKLEAGYLLTEDKKTIHRISQIKFRLKDFQEVITKTGGDGEMEYIEGENVTSKAEETQFKDNLKIDVEKSDIKLDHEDLGKPLEKDGFTDTDIKQGEVGDCYLMSALISLTKDNQALIRNMIVPQGDKFIVTLFEEGIPVKVEVDKQLIVRKIKGYEDSTPAAEVIDDIWVPIIEKAYAKLLGSHSEDEGGDLMKIEGGTSAEALKVLLGNKVKTPDSIYLNQAGEVVTSKTETAIPNPIVLSAIDVNVLAAVIQNANANDYEVHVSSPDQYEGYTLDDQDIVPIDEDNHFMSFKHAYSLVDASSDTVTIRNPHGNTKKEQGLFSETVKKDVTALVEAMRNLEEAFENTNEIKESTKQALDKAITAIEGNDLIKYRFADISKDWKKIWDKKMVFDTGVWKPKKDKKGFLKRLNKKINQLRETINSKAEHADKDGKKLKAGFLSKEIALRAEQTITYDVLKKYFEKVTISIIEAD